jgi:hypothetical protein
MPERESLLPTRFGLAIEGLRDKGKATNFTEKQDFHFELASLSSDLQDLANVNKGVWDCERTNNFSGIGKASRQSNSIVT